MRGLLRAYLRITHFFGGSQRFMRRLAGICLLVMGVHAAGDHIDDLAFGVIDALDLWVDHLVWGACDGLASVGAFSSNAGSRAPFSKEKLRSRNSFGKASRQFFSSLVWFTKEGRIMCRDNNKCISRIYEEMYNLLILHS